MDRFSRKMLGAALLFAALGMPLQAQTGKIEVLWLGQSAFRVVTPGGKTILIDPFITQNPATPSEWKDLSKLGKVDLILVTHGHPDHVGDSLSLARKFRIPLIAPAGLLDSFTSLGLLPTEQAIAMNKSGTVSPIGPEIKISQVHAEHSSEFVYENPSSKKKQVYPGGEPVGFVIKLENGFTLYHLGDTGLFGDMRLIGSRYKPDLILVPIGGHFTMDPEIAAEAARMIQPKFVIPMHYGTFPMLRGTPEEFVQAFGSSSQGTQVFVLKPGEKKKF